MKALALLSLLLLSGCTYASYQKDGVRIRYFSSKNAQADVIKFGDLEVRHVKANASDPIRAGGEAAGEVAKGAAGIP